MEVVFDCKCDLAHKFERSIIENDVRIAEYLNRRARLFREKADRIEVKK